MLQTKLSANGINSENNLSCLEITGVTVPIYYFYIYIFYIKF